VNARPHALLWLVGAIALTSCSGNEESAARAAEVMAQARAVAGGNAWNRIRFLHERGQIIAASGETSEYEHWGDLHTLSVRNNHPGRSNFMVFDGHAAYACGDAQCVSRTLLDPQSVRIGAYLASYGYFFPDRFAASYEHRGTREDSGASFDIVEVVPDGIGPIELWVDQSTHHISRLVYAKGQMRTDLSDYRRVGPLLVPFIARDSGMTIKTLAVRLDPEDANEIAFAPPTAQ
jgi:prepilin-type processing-associated H-X9-DG protein